MKRPSSIFVSCGAALVTSLGAADLLASDTVAVTAPFTTTAAIEPPGTLPNRFLLRSGLFMFGAAYVPALVVAMESDRAQDNDLYAPILGPWFDLASRGDCRGDCGGETAKKALLVSSGVFQGLGALQLLGAFILPEKRSLASRESQATTGVALRVVPASFGHGASGLLARGTF